MLPRFQNPEAAASEWGFPLLNLYTSNLFGDSASAFRPSHGEAQPVVLTIEALGEASVSPVSPALVPFFQAPGRSLMASPMGRHGTEKKRNL